MACPHDFMKNIEDKKSALLATIKLGKSGYCGVLGNGKIVDRREHPEAIPMQENKMMGIPKPMPVDDNGGCPPDCGHTQSEHQAFDRGVADGRHDGIDAENPYEPDQAPDE